MVKAEVEGGNIHEGSQRLPRIEVAIPRYKPLDQKAPSPTRMISPPPREDPKLGRSSQI
jgi:hypothetical protein